jgi:2,4-diketo-3-deoxy-L-fuconate hydrolase
VKLIAYQDGDRRVMARVAGDLALPFASLEDFWADPQPSLRAAAQARSGGEPVAKLVQVPPLPDTARVICAGLNYAAHAEEAHLKLPDKPDIFGRWRSTLAVDGQPVPVPPRDDHFDWEGELAVVIGTELRDAKTATRQRSSSPAPRSRRTRRV